MTTVTAVTLAAVVLGLGEASIRRNGRAWEPAAVGLWAALAIAWAQHVVAPGVDDAQRIIGGGGALVIGVLLRVGAMWSLGSRWQGRGDALVTDHVYSQLRHPGAVGALLSALGAALLLASGWAVAFTVLVLIPTVIVSTRAEERTLADEFGDAWRDYRKAVPALVPRPRWI